MEVNAIKGQQQYLPLPTLECIRVNKVYDWIVKVNQIVDEATIPDDCRPLPLNIEVECEVTDVFCEEKAGAGRRDRQITLPDGTVVTLQEVTIRIFGTYRVTIFDTSVTPKIVHCVFTKSFTRFEKVLLCAPEGTDINCHIVNDTFTECSVLDFNDEVVNVDIIICKSIQAEAEVKLLIEAEFCAPRPEIAIPEKDCVVTFPKQCDAVFPGTSYPYPGVPINP